ARFLLTSACFLIDHGDFSSIKSHGFRNSVNPGGSGVRALSTNRFFPLLMGLGLAASSTQNLAAQDVAITNVRIIVGNGPVVPTGTIVIRGGKIVSAGAGGANTQGLKVIDAKGMSAVPGFIDAHKHINTGPDEKAQM